MLNSSKRRPPPKSEGKPEGGAGMARSKVRDGEMQGDAGRCKEMQGDAGRNEEQ